MISKSMFIKLKLYFSCSRVFRASGVRRILILVVGCKLKFVCVFLVVVLFF